MYRLLCTLTNTIGFLLVAQITFAHSTINLSPTVPTNTEIKKRLLRKAGVFDLRFSQDVHQTIGDYLIRGKKTTVQIIARSQIYFPIIEKYLAAYGMPDELKYLTVIESALDPNARSSAGAVGLWQLIPSTAKRYGLTINSQVDERKDPHKSTQAALQYLSFLYELLGDWTLAAAAYNCGGGGVQKAMRLGNGSNFWAVKSHFPSQTQHYINRLASAVYVMNYYQDHGLEAAETDYFMQFTKMATVYSQLSFAQISQAIDIPIPVLKQLNPSYRKEIVPDSTAGNYLILPKLKMDSFISYYNAVVGSQ
ncbi:MAG: lytic transglycosylase domain-containing protein [Bacteroidota bacterium]